MKARKMERSGSASPEIPPINAFLLASRRSVSNDDSGIRVIFTLGPKSRNIRKEEQKVESSHASPPRSVLACDRANVRRTDDYDAKISNPGEKWIHSNF